MGRRSSLRAVPGQVAAGSARDFRAAYSAALPTALSPAAGRHDPVAVQTILFHRSHISVSDSGLLTIAG